MKGLRDVPVLRHAKLGNLGLLKVDRGVVVGPFGHLRWALRGFGCPLGQCAHRLR